MSAVFELRESPRLSRATVVRDELLRLDPERSGARWVDARVLRVDPDGRVVAEGDHLVLSPGGDVAAAAPREAVLLGQDDDGLIWALPTPELELRDGEVTAGLRSHGALLSAADVGLLTTAVALLGWHANARFCARCGSRTKPVTAGWVRRCVQCGHEEYPRTDPAVICLVHDGSDHALLGRQPSWPRGRFSVLAGFVEAGESLEACVQREVGEEVGVDVREVHYLGSQPWPFPRSIMLGFEATADVGAPIAPRDGEIEEAYWFSRDEVRAALARGEWTGNLDDPAVEVPLLLPGSISIARTMLESWAG